MCDLCDAISVLVDLDKRYIRARDNLGMRFGFDDITSMHMDAVRFGIEESIRELRKLSEDKYGI